MNFEQVRRDPAVRVYIAQADASLEALGFTEHSFPHANRTATVAGDLLAVLGYEERLVELTKISGFLHDIGNAINRIDHSQSGALMAFHLLNRMGFPAEEIAAVIAAIGNHDEGTGVPVSPMAAALILADKSDVRRSRVRAQADLSQDIHDRVNYSVKKAVLQADREEKTITLELDVDPLVSPVMEYFEIFMKRMLLCRTAAKKLDCCFHLVINGQLMA